MRQAREDTFSSPRPPSQLPPGVLHPRPPFTPHILPPSSNRTWRAVPVSAPPLAPACPAPDPHTAPAPPAATASAAAPALGGTLPPQQQQQQGGFRPVHLVALPLIRPRLRCRHCPRQHSPRVGPGVDRFEPEHPEQRRGDRDNHGLSGSGFVSMRVPPIWRLIEMYASCHGLMVATRLQKSSPSHLLPSAPPLTWACAPSPLPCTALPFN